MKKIALLLFITLTVSNLFGQQFNRAKLDSLFEILEKNNKWMGSFAISIDGKVSYAKATGFADIASNKKSTPATKYRQGSISKTFTATLIFKAIEEGKLTLNENLAKYFPTVKNSDQITISNMLNHRSGIFNFTNSSDYQGYYLQNTTSDELVKVISSYNSDFEPDSKAAYSNSNYVLLGFILEKIYQKPLKDLLNEKIIKPLGLKNTHSGSKIDIAENEAYSYLQTGSWEKQTETNMSVPAGAGAVVSTPSDLNIFITALFSGKIISSESLSQMTTIKDNYGFGLRQFLFENEKKGFGHNGNIDSFSSMLYYFPDDKLSISLISNGNTFENIKILTSGLSAYFGRQFNLPSFTSLTLKTEDLDQYLGEYSAPNFPMKITISKKGNVLITQAAGQSSVPMEATAKNIFEFTPAGIVLEFKPFEKQMILKQGPGRYVFTKN
jgi:D-alanyl-D-alanine carboxypeptidase